MVVGITMVRDDLDVFEWTLLHMLGQCDAVIVADNGSIDGTRGMLDGLAYQSHLIVQDDPEIGYFQSRKMTALARQAAELGASWAVPFDSDEVWLSRAGGRLADALDALPDDVLIAEADLWDHVSTAEDPPDANPLRRIGWRRPMPAPLGKVAVRVVDGLTISQGNHGATFDGVDLPVTVTNLLTVRHFPYRSPEQTLRKIRNGAAAYAATDLPSEQGAHWRQWDAFSDEEIRDLFRKWHFRVEPSEPLTIDGERQPALVFDPAPVPCPSPY